MKEIIKTTENNFEKILINEINSNKVKRIVVLGTTSTGKSTILKNHPDYIDMDDAIFPLLTKEESDFVCQTPWTEEIGEKMDEFVRSKLKTEIGKPIFGTVLIDCDLIILISLDKEILRRRCESRNVDFSSSWDMYLNIVDEINKSKIKCIEIEVNRD